MSAQSSPLKQIFDLVRDSPSSAARSLGKEVDGGKSAVNHYLYGYEGVLFEKRGDSPPLWKVISDSAYNDMIKRLNPTRSQGSGSTPSIPKARSELTLEALEPITICGSCDTPIRPNGMCRCS